MENLSYKVTQGDSTRIFAEHGTVKRTCLTTDQEIGPFRNFAFIDVRADVEETVSIEVLNGAEWIGRDLKVDKLRSCESWGLSTRNWRYKVTSFRHY